VAAEPLFDAYVMVDWSAASVPRLGKDSIWICHLRRVGGEPQQAASINVPTRLEARARMLDMLAENVSANLSTLIGFDFPFGYSHGFAARLGLVGPPWRAIWELLASRIEEKPENGNNRFAVAAELNRQISGGPAPFWGCPKRDFGLSRFLQPTHHRLHEVLGLSEKRVADARTKGPQPVWKLVGAGAVGSQALTGIPIVHWLRNHPSLAGASVVWPFETGLSVLRSRERPSIVFAEVYPSLIPSAPRDGEVKDEAQVRTIASYFARLDDAGGLATLFAGAADLTAEERARVEAEESWILGVPRGDDPSANDRKYVAHPTSPRPSPPPRGGEGGPAQRVGEVGRRKPDTRTASKSVQPRYEYLRNPDEIYRESFARIRAEVDLSRFPPELHPVALRLIHAAGEPVLARDLVWSDSAAAAGRAALAAGAPILVDAAMVRAGITARLLPRRNPVLCFLNDRRVPGLARRLGTTRSAAAVELWRPVLAGAVIAIGNAPTALFHLLELIAAGAPLPALVLGFPVGFVGAAEAKAALAANPFGLPFIALAGRRGGSALAATAVNALAGAPA
jgi:precorrin-8X/cobalt-precorrin-8 methylmutase